MKKWKTLGIVLLVLLLTVGAWFWGYYSRKNPDNLPSPTALAALFREKGEEAASKQLAGYSYAQLHEVWGEPDGCLSGIFADIWDTEDGYYLYVYYDDNGIAEQAKVRGE